MRTVVCMFVLSGMVTSTAQAVDWITAPSYYTHDSTSGKRVNQYSPVGPVYVFPRPDYVKSGYRHTRSSLQFGGNIDHLHVVEEWGRPVRPYDEWRFPYRPYSVPYPSWGPVPVPFGAFFGGFPGIPNFPNPNPPNAAYPWVGPNPPWFSDSYPEP